jgi:hypothetical protein
MEKMRLNFDELQVQSFATSGADARRGTVRAHDAPTDQVECPTVDPVWDSCWASCGGSCDCGGSGDCSNYCGSNDCSGTCEWGCYTNRGMISIC